MKATTIAVAIAILITLGNSTNLSAKTKVYTCTTTDPVNNTKTTIISKSDSELHLKPQKKIVFKYDQDGNLQERVSYRWDVSTKNWTPSAKHEYVINSNTLEIISYTEWSESQQEWKENAIQTKYIYDSNGEYRSLVNDKVNK